MTALPVKPEDERKALEVLGARGETYHPPRKRWPGKRQEMRDFNRGTVFWASTRLGTYVHGMVKKNMNRTYGVSRAK